MKKPKEYNETVHVERLDVGKYEFISFDKKYARASEDLADALNDFYETLTSYKESYLRKIGGQHLINLISNAEKALKKAGYTE